MKKTSRTIVFFGSGPVAAKSLRLLAKDFQIEAVITKPRPKHHKGDVPVLATAEALNLPIYTVTDRKTLDQLMATKPFKSQVGVLIDFGIIVSQTVIDSFPLGIVNSHFSLLPEWRGADPITFSILSGQKKTGVSLMLLVAKMDEGPLLAQSEYELSDTITTPQLTADLIALSYEMLRQIIPLYLDGKVHPAPQQAVTLATSPIPTYSRKLTKEDGRLDWNKPAQQLEREIRAFTEWPKSHAVIAGKDIVITQAHVLQEPGKPGKMVARDKKLIVFCSQDALVIDKLKPAGKNEMTSQAFLAGHRSLVQ